MTGSKVTVLNQESMFDYDNTFWIYVVQTPLEFQVWNKGDSLILGGNSKNDEFEPIRNMLL